VSTLYGREGGGWVGRPAHEQHQNKGGAATERASFLSIYLSEESQGGVHLHRHVHVLEVRAKELVLLLLHVRPKLHQLLRHVLVRLAQHVNQLARAPLVVHLRTHNNVPSARRFPTLHLARPELAAGNAP